MQIKVMVIHDKVKYDLTNLVDSVNWSGDLNTLPRTLEVNFQNADDVQDKRLLRYSPGDMTLFYLDGKELFRGFIFKQSLSHTGKESFTAYDETVYITKNADTILVKNKAASDVILSLCKKYGIAVGKISPTGFKIKKKLFENQALSEIFNELLVETTRHTKKRYKIYSSKGKVYMYPRNLAQQVTLSINDVISASREGSIEELKTQVMVTKGSLDNQSNTTETKKKMTAKEKAKIEAERRQNKFVTVTEKNTAQVAKYGIMQLVESVDEKFTLAQMKARAKALLEQNNDPDWTASIEFIGNPACITGYRLKVEDDLTGLHGNVYITSDSHTFSGGTHKMTLQISDKLE